MGMLNWGAAFSKAGDALASVGLEGVKATLEQDKIRLADELAEGRSVREGERGEARSVREGERGEKRVIAAEQRAPGNRAALLNAETPILAERERTTAGIRVGAEKEIAQARLDIEYSPDNIAKKVKALETVGAAEAKVKLDAEMASIVGRAKEPGYLAAVQAIARAQQVLTPGQVAQGELAQIEASRARTLETMRGAYTAAVNGNDQKAAGDIAKAISAYTYDPARETQAVTAARAVVASMDATPEQKTLALNVLMGVASKPQASATGGGKNGWDDATGDVYRNGEKIGTAKTESEARRIYAGKSTPAASPAPSGERPAQSAATAASRVTREERIAQIEQQLKAAEPPDDPQLGILGRVIRNRGNNLSPGEKRYLELELERLRKE